jgi:hypothetical protein
MVVPKRLAARRTPDHTPPKCPAATTGIRTFRTFRVWTPLRMQEVFRGDWLRRFRCFRVSGLIDAAMITAAGLYGDRGSGPDRNRALEALGKSLVFPTPSSDRCAILLF